MFSLHLIFHLCRSFVLCSLGNNRKEQLFVLCLYNSDCKVQLSAVIPLQSLLNKTTSRPVGLRHADK